MAKRAKVNEQQNGPPEILKGWKQIAEFLGEPESAVKRWRSEGMPVFVQGRFVSSSPQQLAQWLGRESGKPLQVVTNDTDLTAELKRGIAFARQRQKKSK